jgi:phosphoglycolate phosphatase
MLPLQQELDAAGIPWVGGSRWADRAARPLDGPDEIAALTLDADVGAVVVGWDPLFSYTRLVFCLLRAQGFH